MQEVMSSTYAKKATPPTLSQKAHGDAEDNHKEKTREWTTPLNPMCSARNHIGRSSNEGGSSL